MEKQSLTSLLNITHPVIMAPMFLVSNTQMVIEGMKSGVAGCIPALNYRTLDELRSSIYELKEAKVPGGSFGYNLIVNKSNVKYKEQLRILCEEGVDFIITSLGSPEETIREAHKVGIKVFCDVTDVAFAQKVEQKREILFQTFREKKSVKFCNHHFQEKNISNNFFQKRKSLGRSL
jgi:nitronate monooxygenase